MINTLLMFAAAGIGFGGSPWIAFAIVDRAGAYVDGRA